MEKKTFTDTNEEIAEKVTTGFHKMSDAVIGAHKKIQDTVVGGYQKIEDAFVGHFLTHTGETVEEAKERLHQEQEALRAGQARREAERRPEK